MAQYNNTNTNWGNDGWSSRNATNNSRVSLLVAYDMKNTTDWNLIICNYVINRDNKVYEIS
jgi:hypothetical protein